MKDLRILAPAFVSGACAMVVELAGSRIIAPYLGTTIYTWAAVIGFVMAALSLGYYLGGRLADRYNDRKHLAYVFLAAAFCTIAVPFLAKVIVPFTVLLPLPLASIISSLVLVPASVFFGMVSPYAIKLTCRGGEEGRSSGDIFAISTAGSILGTLATGFILIPNVGLSAIFVGAAFAMALGAWALMGKPPALESAMLLFLALPVSMLGFAPLVDAQLVYGASSEYYEINVFNLAYNGTSARLLMLDNTFSSAEYANGSILFNYMGKSRLAYGLAPSPGRALVIGSAAGSQVEDLKAHYPGVQVDGVEIDPKTVDAGLRFFSLREDNRTTIYIDDARRHLKTSNATYGLVLVDTFRGTSVPYHLASAEFLDDLKARMAPDGVVAVNLITPVDGPDARFMRLIYNTYGSRFREVVLLPLEMGNLPLNQNVVLIATDRDLSAFRAQHAAEIYTPPAGDGIITDDLNPTDLLVARK